MLDRFRFNPTPVPPPELRAALPLLWLSQGCKEVAQLDQFNEHRCLLRHLVRAGFIVRSITRQSAHPVWTLKLRHGLVPRGEEDARVSAAVARFLKSRRMRHVPRKLEPLVRGDSITASFLWQGGSLGTLSYAQGKEAVFTVPV